jgi:predicted transcriptional regulator
MVGHDYQRIIDGVNYWEKTEPIQVVYLLYDNKKDKYGYVSQRNTDDLKKFVLSNGYELIVDGYNPQSYENTFSSIYQALKREVEEKRRKVLIDTTSTTKEAYGATVTISLMFKNVRIYIVPPKLRGWYAPEPRSQTFNEWFDKTRTVSGLHPQEIYLPGDRLKKPNEEEKKVILKLLDHGGKSRSLTSIIRWCGGDTKDPVTKNRFSRLIRRLKRRGFVEEESLTRSKKIFLTQFGKTIANAIKNYQHP